MYAVSVTALWAYDYLLTLGDEVVEFRGVNGANRNLITSCRSVTSGKLNERAFSVREPSHSFWSTPTDSASVFTLFLIVSTLHYQYHTDLTIV